MRYNAAVVRRALITLFIACSLLPGASTEGKLRRHFEEACRTRKFMGVASVTLEGKTLFSGACGWADAEWNVKNTVDTRFDIASITKEFTAAAVLLLYEQKKLALSDPIGKYIPNLPDSWQSATIHQLLTHTSGVPTLHRYPGL